MSVLYQTFIFPSWSSRACGVVIEVSCARPSTAAVRSSSTVNSSVQVLEVERKSMV